MGSPVPKFPIWAFPPPAPMSRSPVWGCTGGASPTGPHQGPSEAGLQPGPLLGADAQQRLHCLPRICVPSILCLPFLGCLTPPTSPLSLSDCPPGASPAVPLATPAPLPLHSQGAPSDLNTFRRTPLEAPEGKRQTSLVRCSDFHDRRHDRRKMKRTKARLRCNVKLSKAKQETNVCSATRFLLRPRE